MLRKIRWKTLLSSLYFNKVTLGQFFPVNFAKFLRTSFLKNNSVGCFIFSAYLFLLMFRFIVHQCLLQNTGKHWNRNMDTKLVRLNALWEDLHKHSKTLVLSTSVLRYQREYRISFFNRYQHVAMLSNL